MLSSGRSELVEGGKLDEGGGEGIGGLVVVLGALGAAAPVEADRVVAGLALALTVQASGLLFAAAPASILSFIGQGGEAWGRGLRTI